MADSTATPTPAPAAAPIAAAVTPPIATPIAPAPTSEPIAAPAVAPIAAAVTPPIATPIAPAPTSEPITIPHPEAAATTPPAADPPSEAPAPRPLTPFELGVATAIGVVDTHGKRLGDGKELDLTSFRRMRTEMGALIATSAPLDLDTFGRAAYERYLAVSDGKSLVSGVELPAYDALDEKIKVAWRAAADPSAPRFVKSVAKAE